MGSAAVIAAEPPSVPCQALGQGIVCVCECECVCVCVCVRDIRRWACSQVLTPQAGRAEPHTGNSHSISMAPGNAGHRGGCIPFGSRHIPLRGLWLRLSCKGGKQVTQFIRRSTQFKAHVLVISCCVTN